MRLSVYLSPGVGLVLSFCRSILVLPIRLSRQARSGRIKSSTYISDNHSQSVGQSVSQAVYITLRIPPVSAGSR